MNLDENAREFKQLESEIEASEADVEVKRWRQAELAASAVAEGLSRVAYAREVGKGDQTISVFVRMWERWGGSPRAGRPRFADGYATIDGGSAEVITRAEQARRGRERQVPTRHEDRVEMATTLLNDASVAKAVARSQTPAAREMMRATSAVEYEQGQRAAAARDARRNDGAVPIEGHYARISQKLGSWADELIGIKEDLVDAPETIGKRMVMIALRSLGDVAHGIANEIDPDLSNVIQIEG